LPGEKTDQYAEYYAPLETEAEQQAKAAGDGKSASIAGVDVPESVPMPVIIGAAAGTVTFLAVVGIWLHWRRRQLLARNPVGKCSEEAVGKCSEEEDVVVVKAQKVVV